MGAEDLSKAELFNQLKGLLVAAEERQAARTDKLDARLDVIASDLNAWRPRLENHVDALQSAVNTLQQQAAVGQAPLTNPQAAAQGDQAATHLADARSAVNLSLLSAPPAGTDLGQGHGNLRLHRGQSTGALAASVLTPGTGTDGTLDGQDISGVPSTPATCSTVFLPRHPVAVPVLVASPILAPPECVLNTNTLVAAVPLATMGEFQEIRVPTTFTHMSHMQHLYNGSKIFMPTSGQVIASKVPRPMPWPSFMGVYADGVESRPWPWPSFGEIGLCQMNRVVTSASRCSHWLVSGVCDGPAMSSSFTVVCAEWVLSLWDSEQQAAASYDQFSSAHCYASCWAGYIFTGVLIQGVIKVSVLMLCWSSAPPSYTAPPELEAARDQNRVSAPLARPFVCDIGTLQLAQCSPSEDRAPLSILSMLSGNRSTSYGYMISNVLCSPYAIWCWDILSTWIQKRLSVIRSTQQANDKFDASPGPERPITVILMNVLVTVSVTCVDSIGYAPSFLRVHILEEVQTAPYQCEMIQYKAILFTVGAGSWSLRNLYKEQQSSSYNIYMSEAKLLNDICGILMDHFSKPICGIIGVLITWPSSSVDKVLLIFVQSVALKKVELWRFTSAILNEKLSKLNNGLSTVILYSLTGVQIQVSHHVHLDREKRRSHLSSSSCLPLLVLVHWPIGPCYLACLSDQEKKIYSSSDSTSCESNKLELNNRVSYMVQQYTGLNYFGIQAGLHDLGKSTNSSTALMQGISGGTKGSYKFTAIVLSFMGFPSLYEPIHAGCTPSSKWDAYYLKKMESGILARELLLLQEGIHGSLMFLFLSFDRQAVFQGGRCATISIICCLTHNSYSDNLDYMDSNGLKVLQVPGDPSVCDVALSAAFQEVQLHILWDPGGSKILCSTTTAWGQAVFQGGRGVRVPTATVVPDLIANAEAEEEAVLDTQRPARPRRPNPKFYGSAWQA